MDDFVYKVKDGLYINLTNRCTCQCVFCIRYLSPKFEDKYTLWLEKEPTPKEVLDAINDPGKYSEIVFCGYGEPLIRYQEIIEIAKALKKKNKNIPLRVDTNGTANLFFGRNILPELKGLIDKMSISLNGHDVKTYELLCRPIFGDKAFPAVIQFAEEAKKVIPETEITVVDLPQIDKKKCEKIAKKIGVKFRIRSYYEKEYKR